MGLGINLSGGVNVDTGSSHFVGGVQKVEIDGDTFLIKVLHFNIYNRFTLYSV